MFSILYTSILSYVSESFRKLHSLEFIYFASNGRHLVFIVGKLTFRKFTHLNSINKCIKIYAAKLPYFTSISKYAHFT